MRKRADKAFGRLVVAAAAAVAWPYFELRERCFMFAFRMGWWRP